VMRIPRETRLRRLKPAPLRVSAAPRESFFFV
jgi:hypothetical protein